MELFDVIDQLSLTDIYKTFQPNTKRYLYLSTSWNCLQNWPHIPTQSNSHRWNKIEITTCIHWVKAGYQQQQKQQEAYKLTETEQLSE